jgi:hypothetical protein
MERPFITLRKPPRELYSVAVFSKEYFMFGGADVRLAYRNWDNEKYEQADWICLPVYQQLRCFLDHSPDGKLPCIMTADQDYKIPNRYGTTPEDKVNRNALVFSQFIVEMSLHRITKMKGLEVPAEDSIQLGMNEMLESRTITVWLVFACQVFLDIRYILEEDADRGHQELITEGQRIEKIAVGFFKYAPINRADGVMDRLHFG